MGTIFGCPAAVGETPQNNVAGFNWAFVQVYGAYGDAAPKNRTQLNLAAPWRIANSNPYTFVFPSTGETQVLYTFQEAGNSFFRSAILLSVLPGAHWEKSMPR